MFLSKKKSVFVIRILSPVPGLLAHEARHGDADRGRSRARLPVAPPRLLRLLVHEQLGAEELPGQQRRLAVHLNHGCQMEIAKF